jgi:drug/metabolite transporter (DMT)-like permease
MLKNAKVPRYKPSKTIAGILLMLAHALAMALLYVLSKELTKGLHPFQVAFLYKFTILLAIIPWCFSGDYRKNLKTRRIGLHVARGSFSLLGSVCFFVAVTHLPVSNTAAITYLDHILIILIGLFYFREKLNNAKIGTIVFSFFGAALIIKPGFVEFNKYYIYLLLALCFWALNCTVIKMLGATERTKAQLFYMMLFSSFFSLPFAFYEWKPFEMWHVKYLLGISVCYLIHAVAFFKALKYADISTVMPFDYARLVFTGVLGYLVLSEVPDEYSLAGYALIVIGGLYSIYHEARKHKKLTESEKAELEAEHDQA